MMQFVYLIAIYCCCLWGLRETYMAKITFLDGVFETIAILALSLIFAKAAEIRERYESKTTV